MAKKTDQENEIIKLPVTLEGFAFNKRSQDWGISFVMQPENLEMGKPLMNCMGDHFVLMLVRVKSMDNLREALEKEIEGI